MCLCSYRFETLEPEMNSIGTSVTDLNQVAEQLLSSDNCSKDQIHRTRDHLNNRLEMTHDDGNDPTTTQRDLNDDRWHRPSPGGKNSRKWLVKRNKAWSRPSISKTTTWNVMRSKRG